MASVKQRLTKQVVYAIAVLVFALAQLFSTAHALEHAGDADHDIDLCQICDFAERDEDALSPVEFICVTPANFAPYLDPYVRHLVAGNIVQSADSRAPPSN